MKRREFITLLSSAAAFNPVFAWAQQSPSPLIGVLEGSSALSTTKHEEAFRSELRQLGYVEGRNIRLEYRHADGFLDRLPGLAAELVGLNPKVIVSAPLPANLALHQATSTIPIVMATGADPVGFGLVQSLSHPGGNITGLTNFAEELASKQLDLIRELLPGIARIGALVNVTNPLHVPQWQETEAAAAKASLTTVRFDYRVPEDLDRAFAKFTEQKVEAVLVPPDVTFNARREHIVELATKARLPAIYFNRLYAESGGLLSYGPNISEGYRRAAIFVDKILKGAKPGDLPIERPTSIELVINLKTAKALGLNIPNSLIGRADEVIE
jgi:putative tryptophan/tyrosine transport system substrate-binding protein